MNFDVYSPFPFSNVRLNFSGAALRCKLACRSACRHQTLPLEYTYTSYYHRDEKHSRHVQQLWTSIKNFSLFFSSVFFFHLLHSASIFNNMQIRNRTTFPYHELSLTDDPARWKNRSRAKMGDSRIDRHWSRSRKVHGTFAVPEEEIHVSVGRQLA